jgi:hypothetical protein
VNTLFGIFRVGKLFLSIIRPGFTLIQIDCVNLAMLKLALFL